MQDREIKELLKRDHSQPVTPQDEWQKISRKIKNSEKKERPSWTWTMAPTLVAACTVLILAIFPNGKKTSFDPQDREELARYLFEDSLPYEEDQSSLNRFDSL
jgi:hypothetical protein